MEKNYYQTQLELIEAKIKAGEWAEAQALVKDELAMPFIPGAYLSQFKEQEQTIAQALRQSEPIRALQDPEAILDLLKKDELSQLKALDAMSKLNLRAHDDLIREAFRVLEDRLLINLLIRLLIEQAITEEFGFKDDGVEYTFIPASLTLPEDSDGYLDAHQLFRNWLDKDPSMLQLCLDQLQLVSLLKLPETYEADEAEELALEILEPIYCQLQDVKSFESFLKTHDLKKAIDVALFN